MNMNALTPPPSNPGIGREKTSSDARRRAGGAGGCRAGMGAFGRRDSLA